MPNINEKFMYVKIESESKFSIIIKRIEKKNGKRKEEKKIDQFLSHNLVLR
jgi:hypothetical protein